MFYEDYINTGYTELHKGVTEFHRVFLGEALGKLCVSQRYLLKI
jgi:hypothetical protein